MSRPPPKKTRTNKNSKKNKNTKTSRDLISRAIDNSYSIADTYFGLGNTSITVTETSLLDGLLSSNGALANYPQTAHATSYGTGVRRLNAKVRLHGIEMQIRVEGSQSNVLAAGDLFNTVRVAIAKVGNSYLDTTTYTFLNGTDLPLNLLDVKKLYYDRLFDLPMQAFNTATNYNAPQVVSHKFEIPLNFDVDVFSTTASGSLVTWDTKQNDILLRHCSDSSASPHPQIAFYARVFFTMH